MSRARQPRASPLMAVRVPDWVEVPVVGQSVLLMPAGTETIRVMRPVVSRP